MLERLLSDHGVMRERGEALLALLGQADPPSPEVLAFARWQLGSHIMQHLAFEDRHLYAKLISDRRPYLQDIGRRFQRELAELFNTYTEHARQWTPQRIAADWHSFRMMARARILDMYARMDQEEADLFPVVRDAAIDLAPQAVPTRNWARDAFSIKDAMTQG